MFYCQNLGWNFRRIGVRGHFYIKDVLGLFKDFRKRSNFGLECRDFICTLNKGFITTCKKKSIFSIQSKYDGLLVDHLS